MLDAEDLSSFPAFRIWAESITTSLGRQYSDPNHPFRADPYALRGVEVRSCTFFGSGEKRRLGFMHLDASVTTRSGDHLPGGVFLRGGSVAMLIVVTPDESDDQAGRQGEEEEYAILALQPRIPAGSLGFLELPAGMLDEETGNFAGAAAREIKEETGLDVRAEELVELTTLAVESQSDGRPRQEDSAGQAVEAHLQRGVYPSPGGSDEYIAIFLARKRLPRRDLDGLRGKLTGLRDEGENITLKIVPLKEVWRHGARDGKTLAAIALYEGLRREGRV